MSYQGPKYLVDKVQVHFSAKRSLRLSEDYHTAESSETWDLIFPDGPVSVEDARKAALNLTPTLMGKIITDLRLFGVLRDTDSAEMKSRMEIIRTSYRKVTDDPGTDSRNLQTDGRTLGLGGTESTEGSSVSS